MTIGDIIKQFRMRQGISQRKFAERTGLSNYYISILQANVNPRTGLPAKPSIDSLKAIAEVMQISLDDLLRMMDDDTVITVNDTSEREQIAEMTHQLRENPKLRLLFDKTSKMSSRDMDAVLGVVNAILRERDGDDD